MLFFWKPRSLIISGLVCMYYPKSIPPTHLAVRECAPRKALHFCMRNTWDVQLDILVVKIPRRHLVKASTVLLPFFSLWIYLKTQVKSNCRTRNAEQTWKMCAVGTSMYGFFVFKGTAVSHEYTTSNILSRFSSGERCFGALLGLNRLLGNYTNTFTWPWRVQARKLDPVFRFSFLLPRRCHNF